MFEEFLSVDIRVGKIVEVLDFPSAKNPSYRLKIDFGWQIGIKKSCAQVTNYTKNKLVGKQVVCVVNFPAKQIGNSISEVLVLGVPTESKGIALLTPDMEAILGSRVF
jgi:tRNA-binding protein